MGAGTCGAPDAGGRLEAGDKNGSVPLSGVLMIQTLVRLCSFCILRTDESASSERPIRRLGLCKVQLQLAHDAHPTRGGAVR